MVKTPSKTGTGTRRSVQAHGWLPTTGNHWADKISLMLYVYQCLKYPVDYSLFTLPVNLAQKGTAHQWRISPSSAQEVLWLNT